MRHVAHGHALMALGGGARCDKPARRGALCLCCVCVVWRVETPETPALKLSLRTASSRHGSRRMQDAGCRMLDECGFRMAIESEVGFIRRAPAAPGAACARRRAPLFTCPCVSTPRHAARDAGASCLPSRRALRTSASMRGTSSETPLSWSCSWSCSCTCQHAAVGMLAPPRPELDDGG
jgi:hypothetical protein